MPEGSQETRYHVLAETIPPVVKPRSRLLQRGIAILQAQVFGPYQCTQISISKGELFLIQDEFEVKGLAYLEHELSLTNDRQVVIHVHKLEGSYSRSIRLELFHLPHRFRHDSIRGRPEITVHDDFIHVRDRLYTGSYYVDYLFAKTGGLIASWTDDIDILKHNEDLRGRIAIYSEKRGSRWTVASPERKFLGQYLIHSSQRTDSYHQSFFGNGPMTRATKLSRLASTGGIDTSPKFFDDIGATFDLFGQGPRELHSDRHGVWLYRYGHSLSFHSWENGDLFEVNLDPSELEAKIINLLNDEESSREFYNFFSDLTFGGDESALMEVALFTRQETTDPLTFGQIHARLRDTQIIIQITGGEIVIFGLYKGREMFDSQVDEFIQEEGSGIRPLSWSDLFHEDFDDGKLISQVFANDRELIFITDFYNDRVTFFEPLAPLSMIRSNATASDIATY